MSYVEIPYSALIQAKLCFAINESANGPQLLRFETSDGTLALAFSSVEGFATFFDDAPGFVELDLAQAVDWLTREELDLGFDFHADHASIIPTTTLAEIASTLAGGGEIGFALADIDQLDDPELKDRLNHEFAHLAANTELYLAAIAATPTLFAVHRAEDPSALAAKIWPILAAERENAALGFVPLSREIESHRMLIARLDEIGIQIATPKPATKPPILR